MKFSYQARTKEGEIQTGFVEASSREAALGVLQKYGLYVTFLSEEKQQLLQKRIDFLQKTTATDVIAFTRQLSIMLKSNIPVVESLETIARQIKKPALQESIIKAAEEIEGGTSLSKAFSRYPKLFSSFYIGMIRAGETSGRVPESLDYLASYVEKRQDFTSKLIMGLIYPAFVLLVFFAVLLVMGIVVVPRFAEVFEGMETELPLVTRLVMDFSNVLKRWWPFIVIFLVLLVFSLIFLYRSKETRKTFDNMTLKVPLMGGFFKKFFLARVALNLSTMVAGGIAISEALEITADVVGNEIYKDVILKTRDRVRAGQSISSVLLGYQELFPLFFTQMVVVGERTGHLENTLTNIVAFYEKDVDRTLDSFVKTLEPLMLIFLGGLVAMIALSLYIPLFQKGLTI